MRLTQHEDGWIYGVFCSESKDKTSNDLSAATAQAGIVRTKDLKTWERLPNLKSKSPQQKNVVLTLSSLTESTHSTHVHRTILSKLAQAEEYASVFAKTSQTLLSAQTKLLSRQGSITQSQR